MKLTSGEVEGIPVNLVRTFSDMENRIMSRIVETLKNNGSDITSAVDWKLHRLNELGKTDKDIKKYIQDALKLSDDEIDRVFTQAMNETYTRDKTLYESAEQPFIPYEDNQELQQLVNAVNLQTKEECRNITQSLGFAKKQSNGKLTYTPVGDFYRNTLDTGLMEIATGITDYNTVLNRVVSDMTNSGLRFVDYESGWSNRVDVACRRALLTGYNQVVAKVNEDNAESLGTEYFEVSYHSGARPTHQEWQGRVYTKEQLESVCGLGDVTGLCGANCYHSYSPFIMGISVRTYTDEEIDRMNAEDNTPREYNGKQYTKYEALQRQRRLETTMRAERQKINLLIQGGADEDDILSAKVRYNGTSDEYVKFSRAMGLPQQRQRVTVDGLGNIGNIKKQKTVNISGAKTVEKSDKSGIIKEKSSEPITKITDSAISRVPKVNIDGYSDEQCAEIQKQHKELLKYSRDKNENKEVAFVFRKDLSDRTKFLGEDDKLDFGTGLIGKGNDLIVMHNHPRNSSFSVTDLVLFKNYSNVKTLTIAKNNGSVEYITKSKDFDSKKIMLEYDRLYQKIVINNTDSEKDKFIKTLLNKTKSGVIWSERK